MEAGKLDYLLLLKKGLRYWYLYLVMLAGFVFLAIAYLKYKQPAYSASIQILIEDDKDSRRLSEETLFSELGFGKVSNNLLNEMAILISSPLIKQVVEKLELQYRYFSIDGWIKREMYKHSPVEVISWEPSWSEAGFHGVLSADKVGGYQLEIKDKSLGDNNVFSGEFGKSLRLPMGRLTLSNRESSHIPGQIGIQVLSTGQMAGMLKDKLDIRMSNEKASLVEIAMKDVAPERIHDVLTAIVREYNQNSVDKKNQVFENTIDLINTRIELIIDELSAAEQDVENYKQRFSMTELSSEGTLLMSEVSAYNKQIASTQLQLEILNSIEDFLERNRESFEFVPTNASITDLTLVSQIQSFNQSLSERERKRSDLGPSHPDLIVIERQIRNLRETIVASIRSIKRDLNTALDANVGVKGNLQARLHTLPRRERELIEIERRKSIKENLYLYLLQKREEAAISMAVTSAKSLVVEPADLPWKPVSPNKAQILLNAVFLGLAFPFGIVLLIHLLDNRIQAEDDIERATGTSILGAVTQYRRGGRLAVKENSRSFTAEAFRMLRANLSYVASGQEMKTVLITSGISGEGKSFISLNLGVIEALAKKKVIILELDLRKPKLELYQALDTEELGIVSYLVDPSLCVDDVIVNSGAHPDLDIIRCGPKPPNPSELILSDRLRELVAVLKSRYDMIILDTPPVGLVADALQMKDLADVTLFVLRMGYSRRPELRLVRDIVEKSKLPRPFVLLNSIRPSGGGAYSNGYSYGYGYSYGNGNGYFEDDLATGSGKMSFFSKKLKSIAGKVVKKPVQATPKAKKKTSSSPR
jgi:tyrosine-protein kinase Etk/Wzc